MGKVIVIASGKGGVGKTVAVSNIAVALAKLKKKVLIADIDIGLRNLDLYMGVEDVIVYDIMDVIDSSCDIEKAIFRFPKYGNLDFLPAAQSVDKDFLEPEKFKELFDKLKNEYDYIIVDCPAGIEKGFKSAIASCDLALLVVTPDMASIRDADKVVNLLNYNGINDVKLILNRVIPQLIHSGDMISIDEIIYTLGIPPIGIVIEDIAVLKSQRNKAIVALDSSSEAGNEFNNIAKRLDGENIPITNLSLKAKRNIFKRLFSKNY